MQTRAAGRRPPGCLTARRLWRNLARQHSSRSCSWSNSLEVRMPRCLVRSLGLCAGVLLLLAASPDAAQAQSGTVQGKVTDSTGAAIVGAVVTVDGTTLRATSTGSGRYTLRGVPPGPGPCGCGRSASRPTRRAVTVAGARRHRAGHHPGPLGGGAGADRRGHRLPRPAHRGRGARGAGGCVHRGGDPAAGHHARRARSCSRSPRR